VELFVLDGTDVPSPEDLAMLSAMYSRDPASVTTHLEKVRRVGSGRFMSTFYCGFGHKSVGDCGFVTMFIEGVSMLAAKAIQDTPLYNGQEASTRYLDMTKQVVLNPLGTPEGAALQVAWMALYEEALATLVPQLEDQHPKQPDEKESVWKKAIKARAFDIARSLLPAGVTTNVAWSANLRQANDHLKELRHHPLTEVREIGEQLHAKLLERYPNSFGHVVNEAEESYIEQSMDCWAFSDFNSVEFEFTNGLDRHTLSNDAFVDLLTKRPPRAELHQRFRRFGSIDLRFSLDFGSFRDLQRHRSAVIEMPLLRTFHGFHPWYLEHLPVEFGDRIADLTKRLPDPNSDQATRQYYVPMGFLVQVEMSCTLPAAVYIAELRSGQSVHPTLRVRAQQMGEVIRKCVPGIAMHHDMSPDTWSIRRGQQDIVVKSEGENP
jgi:thymidylate synthase ThyX